MDTPPHTHSHTHTQVLDSYTASFDFTNLKFDAAIRLFLESFRLPGERKEYIYSKRYTVPYIYIYTR